MRSKYIWMNGKLVSFEQATVHVLNPTMHYGTGVFEWIRCYKTSKGSAVFRLKEHLQRLIESTQIVGIYDYPFEEPISRDQLYIAVEVFVSGTAAEIVPVREIDYRRIRDGRRGQVTKLLQDLFSDAVRGLGPRSHAWLDYVDETVMAV